MPRTRAAIALLLSLFLASQIAAQEAGKKKVEDDDDALPKGAVARLGTWRFRCFEGGGYRAVLSPGGDLLALFDSTGKPCVIDAKTGRYVPQFAFLRSPPKSDWPIVDAFSPDGKLAIAVGNKSVRLFDVVSGKRVHQIDTPDLNVDSRLSVTVSQDSKRLALAVVRDKAAYVLSLETGKRVAKLPLAFTEQIRLALSPDGSVVAGIGIAPNSEKPGEPSVSRTIQIWDVRKEKELHRPVAPDDVPTTIAFSPDDKLLASGTGFEKATFILWDIATGKEHRRIQAEEQYNYRPRFLAFSHDGRRLATSDWYGRVQIWDTKTGKQLTEHRPPAGFVSGMAFRNDAKVTEEKLVVWGTQGRAVWIWDSLAKTPTPWTGTGARSRQSSSARMERR